MMRARMVFAVMRRWCGMMVPRAGMTVPSAMRRWCGVTIPSVMERVDDDDDVASYRL